MVSALKLNLNLIALGITLLGSLASAQLKVTQPTADHWCKSSYDPLRSNHASSLVYVPQDGAWADHVPPTSFQHHDDE